jgi:hypothetical protein
VEFDVDGEEARQGFLKLANPDAAMLVVDARHRIDAAQPGSSHTAAPTVVDADASFVHNFASSTGGHRHASLT